jgi:hypothetical protein
MTAILSIVERLLAIATQILGLVTGLWGTASREHDPYSTELNAEQANSQLADPTTGLVAIKAVENTIDTRTTTIATTTTNTYNLLASGNPLLSAPNQHIDYAPNPLISPNAFAYYLWHFPMDVADATTPTMDRILSDLWRTVNLQLPYGGLALASAIHFRVQLDTAWLEGGGGLIILVPQPDWSDIRATDTRLTWLNRTEPTFTWAEDPVTHVVTGYQAGVQTVTLDLSEQEFRQLAPTTATYLPPVWPGLANVTLGTPVALVDQLDVSGPLSGILTDTTVAPSGRTVYPVGAVNVYYQWGQVVFTQDNGQSEPFQWLATGQGMYLPRQMVQAASAHLRVLGSPTGTVTPFTIP